MEQHRLSVLSFVAFTSIVSLASAQRTWLVDAANGPGTNFIDLPPALAAAADGDTIRVKPGTYLGGTTGKALKLLGETGAKLTGAPFVVTGLPAGRTFVMKRFECTGSVFQLTSCSGRVHLEDIQMVVAGYYQAGLAITSCTAVSVLNSRLAGAPAVSAVGSNVALTRCTLPGAPSYPALRMGTSTVITAGGTITGGDGNYAKYGYAPPAMAVVVESGTLVLGGDATTTVKAGTYLTFSNPAIQTLGGSVRIDPAVQLIPASGAQAITGPGVVTFVRIPALWASGGPPGGTAKTDLYAASGALAVLFAGHASDPIALGIGSLWIKPDPLMLLDASVMPGGEHQIVNVPIPNDPALAGVPIAFQSVVIGAGTTLSTPAIVVLH